MPASILVVDDEPVVAEVISEILTSEGYSVTVANSGSTALKIMERRQPDLLLTDLRMPEMSGEALFAEVKEHFPKVGVVIVTAVDETERAVSLMLDGAYDYVTKPFNAAALRVRVGRALERLRMTRELEEYRKGLELQVARQTAQLQAGMRAVNRAYRASLAALSVVLQARDQQTGVHADRVVYHSLLLGKKMSLSKDQLMALEQGAILHDIGKVGIPDSILLKPARLTPEEMAVVKSHPVIGCRIIEGIPYLHPAIKVVRHHHEWWDGSGYPEGLQGQRIPVEARLFAVVDAFDAMTSDRPYRAAMPENVALEELRKCARSQFDPDAVDCFSSFSPDELALPKTAGPFIGSELMDQMVGRTLDMTAGPVAAG